MDYRQQAVGNAARDKDRLEAYGVGAPIASDAFTAPPSFIIARNQSDGLNTPSYPTPRYPQSKMGCCQPSTVDDEAKACESSKSLFRWQLTLTIWAQEMMRLRANSSGIA